jgi:uncharacterized protein YbbK (DUF523 family)
MEKEKLLISSCLLGNLVKYNGDHNGLHREILLRLKEKYDLYSVCPEVDGGLPTPRIPCEIISTDPIQIHNKNGEDKTQEFLKGAKIALEVCKKEDIKLALMKANSPSCSNSQVNDGTFTKTRIDRLGITAQLLQDHGLKIFNENEIEKLIS